MGCRVSTQFGDSRIVKQQHVIAEGAKKLFYDDGLIAVQNILLTPLLKGRKNANCNPNPGTNNLRKDTLNNA